MKIAIVTPTTGNPYLARAIYSVRYQSVPVDHYVFVDGKEYWARAYELTREYKHLKVVQLPENTGKGGFNGHRIYAACSHLVNADYVLLCVCVCLLLLCVCVCCCVCVCVCCCVCVVV